MSVRAAAMADDGNWGGALGAGRQLGRRQRGWGTLHRSLLQPMPVLCDLRRGGRPGWVTLVRPRGWY
jgi:hypothetical protein